MQQSVLILLVVTAWQPPSRQGLRDAGRSRQRLAVSRQRQAPVTQVGKSVVKLLNIESRS